MKKLLVVLLLGAVWAGKSEAAIARGAKPSTVLFGNSNVVGVSTGAAVVYSILLSTGTAGTDYVVLFDSGSATGLSSTLQASGGYKSRVYLSSATQSTLIIFDPPLQFNSGIMASNSSTIMTSVITYEKGRVTQGY